jgi:hypothetical protein
LLNVYTLDLLIDKVKTLGTSGLAFFQKNKINDAQGICVSPDDDSLLICARNDNQIKRFTTKGTEKNQKPKITKLKMKMAEKDMEKQESKINDLLK